MYDSAQRLAARVRQQRRQLLLGTHIASRDHDCSAELSRDRQLPLYAG
jgi:hypothetical protein